jgi:hypothetical protein
VQKVVSVSSSVHLTWKVGKSGILQISRFETRRIIASDIAECI